MVRGKLSVGDCADPLLGAVQEEFEEQAWFEASLLARAMLYAEVMIPAGAARARDSSGGGDSATATAVAAAAAAATRVHVSVAHTSSGLWILLESLLPAQGGCNVQGGRQALNWVRWLREQLRRRRAGPDDLIIAVGDLNMGPGYSEYCQLQRAMQRDLGLGAMRGCLALQQFVV